MATERDAQLTFLKNEALEDEGLGHAGIETYKDNPYGSVARECGQNSADARAHSPVVMSFDLIHISATEYPPRAQQMDALEACLRKAQARHDQKEIEFFSRALEVLKSEQIPILRIADVN